MLSNGDPTGEKPSSGRGVKHSISDGVAVTTRCVKISPILCRKQQSKPYVVAVIRERLALCEIFGTSQSSDPGRFDCEL